jgi:hypothetical protein
MNQEVQDHIEKALSEIRALYTKAATRIEAIPVGGKIPATQLAEDLAKEQGMTGPQLYPTLKVLLDDYPGVVIRRGAHGGIYRPLPAPVPVQTDDEQKVSDKQ